MVENSNFNDHSLNLSSISRRQFLGQTLIIGGALFTAPGLFAEMLSLTPKQAEGPFYPNLMPLDTDNDLLVLNDQITPAVGEITHLHGKVTDVKGNPLRNALVEIWQVDNTGAYIHTKDPRNPKRDKNFQGYGRFSTGMKGEYYFRTIKPVSYPGRTPHIHVMVSHKGKNILTTQLYIAGEERNKKDGLLMRAGGQMAALLVDFTPLKDSKLGELSAEFNIIVGVTPEDQH